MNRSGPGPGEEVSMDMDSKGAVPVHGATGLNQKHSSALASRPEIRRPS